MAPACSLSLQPAPSVMVSADVPDLDALNALVRATAVHPVVSSYKVGLELVIPYGLTRVVENIKAITDKPIIYDMQKAATDIPDLGKKFARACKASGVDAVILFPLTGPETERAWIIACQAHELPCIVGGEMTHRGFRTDDGGWIDHNELDRIYRIAKENGVSDFVVPGTKPARIAHYRKLLGNEATFYSPGLITQGGDIKLGLEAAGQNWHAIVGRAIYESVDPNGECDDLARRLGVEL